MSDLDSSIRAVVDLASEPTAVLDPHDVIRHANPALCAWIGRDPAGEPSGEVFAATAHDRLAEARLDQPAGWRVCSVRSTARSPTELVVRSGILEALVDAAPVAILALDLEKRVVMWNPSCERIFGWTAAEIVGQPYPLVPTGEWSQFELFFNTVIRGQGFNSVEAVRSDKHGRALHVAISTAPIRGADGAVTGAMAMLEDITARKQLEEQYRQAQKMEAVGRLAGGIAHDFNNVLTVILAYCDLLLTSDGPAPVLADVAAIQRAAERAADLTGQLLAFGRRSVLQTRVVDVNEAIRGSAQMLERLIGEDVAVRLELEPRLPATRIDTVQLERLLMNLAANARDAMPDGGQFTIRTRRAAPQLAVGRGEILIEVTDTGIGMDEETLSHVFEPFFTTKELGRGTGLGLASVYGIVRQSGGQIGVESRPNEGTTFRILLPEERGAPAETPTEPAWEPRLGTGTILLVEDDPAVREVVERALASRGFDVLAAHDGEEALKLAQDTQRDIRLLLTDVVMGGMNGRQLAGALAPLRPDLRVLFMSGYTGDDVLRRGVERGQAFLHKPFTSAELFDAVQRALDA